MPPAAGYFDPDDIFGSIVKIILVFVLGYFCIGAILYAVKFVWCGLCTLLGKFLHTTVGVIVMAGLLIYGVYSVMKGAF